MKHDRLNCQNVLSEGSSRAPSIEFPPESCLAHLISLFMSAVGHVWRGTLNTGIRLSVQTSSEEWNIHPPDCLQTPGEESIKHNIGFSLSLRLPMGFESPMWRRRLYSRIWKHQSFILMFELISREHLQNKKIWCCLWDLWPSEISQPVFKSMFWRMHRNSP